MLFSLEGKARRNFRHCDEHGDLSPAGILKWMDMSYNASVDFRDLNASMPYGLCNAPATFQRLMQNCLGELNLTYALVYLYDVIVYSKTEEDHLRQLQAVFKRFHEHGLKLKPSKCSFLRK